MQEQEHLNNRWQDLCGRYLPISPAGSIWRHSRPATSADPDQGWKLHIAATVLSAIDVFEKAAPLLKTRGVMFKAPASLWELARINNGLSYGYSQVGKFITVYPRTRNEAKDLAGRLHKLTSSFSAPQVPFDLRFRPASNVYYRYGSFRHLEMVDPDGQRMAALRDPQGALTPDSRYSHSAKPLWADNLFPIKNARLRAEATDNPLHTTYQGFLALAQRGKGGVYKALDSSRQPPRLCLLKEGRRHGEVGWDGRDGFWRIENEEHVLTSLRVAGIDVPRVLSSFVVDGNKYLVTEFLAGENLHAFLMSRSRRLAIKEALRLAVRLAELFRDIHRAGWAWRDGKPSNIIINHGTLRPIDFEGACPIDQSDPVPWCTPAFVAPEWRQPNSIRSAVREDTYSLGAIIYLLLTGRTLDPQQPVPLERLRRGVPEKVRVVVGKLLSPNPESRPTIVDTVKTLRTALRSVANSASRA